MTDTLDTTTRYRPYPAYRDSGVEWLGEVPAHWQYSKLGFQLVANDGGVWGEDSEEGIGTIVLRSTEQNVDGTWKIVDPAYRKLSLTEKQEGLLKQGDLLITKSSGSALHIGKTSLVTDEVAALNCCFSNFMQRVRFSKNHLPSYFYYVLNNRVGRSQFDYLASTTTGLANLNASIIGDLIVPLPSLPEQRAIVAFLDRETAKLDALIARKERLIALLEEKRAALISHAVTKGLDEAAPTKDSGVSWLGEVPAHWDILHLRRVVTKFVDYRGATPTKVASGVPLITARNIKGGEIDFGLSQEFISEEEYSTRMVRGFPKRGDVLVTTEAPLGEVAQIVDEDIALAQRIILLKAHEGRVTNDYLKNFLRSLAGQGELWSRATGSTAIGIKASHLKEISVLVPPIGEQERIVNYLYEETAHFDAIIAKNRRHIGLLRERRAALIAAAVTGKIDVRGAT